MTCWVKVSETLPPQGMVVYTKVDHGNGIGHNHCLLKLIGRLWVFADDSMYVYYTPTHWRYK